MPWKEATKVSEREELIRKWRTGLYGVSELAAEFGVSRPTVYEWARRYSAQGEAGLIDRPPVAKSCPHRTAAEIADQIVAAKREHPHWGPAKLIDLLRIERPQIAWPSASTAGSILKAQGLVRARRKRRSGASRYARRLEASESGEMMTVDHKGQFRLGDGSYCFPLTINDPVSRFSYAIAGARSTSWRDARGAFERVFEEYGVPEFIGSDNGAPFSCSQALLGLSAMSVWWIKLGITPVRTHPGCPWENGIHERMHRTLKAETTRPLGANLRQQQERFDAFRTEYNTVRPHEGLGGKRPQEVLRPCRRPYRRQLPRIEYPGHFEVRSVRSDGSIKWQGRLLFVSESVAGERLGLVEIDDGVWSVHFAHLELGRYDERTRLIR
ncbi:MAG TPA: IS481 family transposase [Thermoanaerobaculia bacterium]|nr:IS481 family transposase [Thermoanaerobaculia bacterium]